MRPLALALAVLCTSPAHAVPVTSYAMGVVAEDRSVPSPFLPVHVFTPGEAVYVEYTIDDDPGAGYPFPARLRVELFTADGWRSILMTNNLLPGISEGGGDSLRFAQTDRGVELSAGVGGFLAYSRDIGPAGEGFLATLAPADPADFPAPEPSTLALGLVGVGLLGLGRAIRQG